MGARLSPCLEGVRWGGRGAAAPSLHILPEVWSHLPDTGFPVPGHSSASSEAIPVLQPPSPSHTHTNTVRTDAKCSQLAALLQIIIFISAHLYFLISVMSILFWKLENVYEQYLYAEQKMGTY